VILYLFFFFQAEDGIRDRNVTGVQTCALPILAKGGRGGRGNIRFATPKNPAPELAENGEPGVERKIELELKVLADVGLIGFPSEIGRASCRERVWVSRGAGA